MENVVSIVRQQVIRGTREGGQKSGPEAAHIDMTLLPRENNENFSPDYFLFLGTYL